MWTILHTHAALPPPLPLLSPARVRARARTHTHTNVLARTHRSCATLRLRGGSAATEEATSYPSFITEKNDFNHVIRIFNTNLHGRRTVLYSLTGIKGVGRRFGDAVIKRAGIDGTKRMGELTAEEVEKLVQVRVRKNPTTGRCAPLPAAASLQRGSGGKRERREKLPGQLLGGGERPERPKTRVLLSWRVCLCVLRVLGMLVVRAGDRAPP